MHIHKYGVIVTQKVNRPELYKQVYQEILYTRFNNVSAGL